MAEALVSFLVGELASVVLEEVKQEVRLVVGVRKEVEKLTRTFKVIQTVLNDAEQRQMNDESVKLWLEEFKSVAYDMEDVLDEWRTVILRSQMERLDNGKGKKKVSSYLFTSFSCFNKVALRHDIGSKIKEIRERLDYIETEIGIYQFIPSKIIYEGSACSKRPKTSSIIVDPDICGRDSDKFFLSKLLGVESSSYYKENEISDPRIISIIGMGGLGKTTLAQLVFNDNQVQTHFVKTMWVCVSDHFDLLRIAKLIIQEATQIITSSTEWNNSLHQQLCDSVKGKKFLLVLDDVWTEDSNNLNPLKHLLSYGAQGSRILITTRIETVASMMNSYKYFLGSLSFDDCWSLLCRKAFVGRKKEDNEVLKEVSIEIAKKCKGLPLAVNILGSLLSKKRTKQDWCRVLESKVWELKGIDQQKLLKPALLLSYDDLPSPLKNCFAYCAIFPTDYKIKKHTLIKMWMAQGFLNTTEIDESELESIGDGYFNDLASRSFFQDFSVDDDGSIIYCKMHDLVHEFAQFLTKNECYMKHNGDMFLSNDNSKVRHLTFVYNKDEKEPSSFRDSISKVANLRTLHVMSNKWMLSFKDTHLSDVFHHLRCLRVLNLKGLHITFLPKAIEKLIHLRYLNLSGNKGLSELPDSMCSLYNLQTLKLKDCRSLRKLPEGIGRMINLRHLYIKWAVNLEYLPKGIGKLNFLQTLSKFVVSSATGGCKLKELKDLNLLQGEIEITGLGRLKTAEEASEAELQKKQQLYDLILDFKPNDAMSSKSEGLQNNMETLAVERMEGVLGLLCPHPNLKKLNIGNYLGSKWPSWVSNNSMLTSLCSLVLYNCSNCTELPALGLLPSLEMLKICNLEKLRRIGVEIYNNGSGGQCARKVAFPKLKTLEIYTVNSMEVWEFGDGEVAEEIMPCVTSIILLGCKNLKALPALGKLSSLETLEIKEAHQVTHIGREFYGVCGTVTCGGGQVNLQRTAFPKLKSLVIEGLLELVELDLGVFVKDEGNEPGEVIIMPCLCEITIERCSKLKMLRALSKLPSLRELHLYEMNNLEVFKTGVEVAEQREKDFPIVLPCLLHFYLTECPKLKSMSTLHLPMLAKLIIWVCSSLSHLPISPKLTTLEISCFSNSSLPEGLEQLKELKSLVITRNDNLTCIPEYVQNLTELQKLTIEDCRQLTKRCRRGGDDWKIISHISNIIIDKKQIQ